ncbi:MAG: dethiobiotin synthase [Sandaracinaceae bacterium]|nr:dethiobiotin synthase [Sandaracinaceae bacterium]
MRVMRGLFVSGTGTGVGKTWVTRGLARALARGGERVVALKPIETGCDPEPADAIALARACGRPELARAPGLYRARLPAAPYAAQLEGEPAPDLGALAARARELARADLALVEGAGGLLVPATRHQDMADLARALALPIGLVAVDALGVLSDVLAYVEVARARGLAVAWVALTPRVPPSGSPPHNAAILAERLAIPVQRVAQAGDEDDALADAVERAGLVELTRALGRTPSLEGG